MKRAIVFAFMVLTAAKVVVAARLDLFGDESFYWQCGQRPALAYADHPPVTALLTRLGTEIAGDSSLGVRLIFLMLGATFPLIVYWLAQPLVGRRDAWLAAGTALCIPALAQLGLLAVPDAALLPLTALFLLGFERATRQGPSNLRHTGFWLLAGFAGAVGLATHYRFVLVPVAALAYLLVSRHGRGHWHHRGPWLMLATLSIGLAPSVVYNLGTRLAPVRYYLAGRHGTHLDAGALFEHLAAQAILVTPILYVMLIGVLVTLCRKALAGDDRAALAVSFSLVYLGLFFLASPFEDSGLIVAHWPVPGYVALLPYLPAMLRRLVGKGMPWRAVAVLAPALGALIMGLLLAELGTGRLRLGSVREPFVGWSEVGTRVRSLAFPPEKLESPTESPAVTSARRVIVADNYKLGANLEFALPVEADVYVLDHHKNHEHGRAPQLAIWKIDEQGLRGRAGEEALLIIEVSQILTGQHDAWLAHAGSFFESLQPAGELRIASPGKRKKFKLFRFYRGRLLTRGTTQG